MGPSEMLAEAVALLWVQLRDLAGGRWTEYETRILPLLRALEGGDEPVETRKQLLELLSGIEGARERLTETIAELLPDGRERAGRLSIPDDPGVRHVRHAVVPVGYATDRAATTLDEGFFSGERGALVFGTAEVSIPDDHRVGALEKPRWWKLEFRPNPDKHVVVLSVDGLDRERFVEHVRGSIGGAVTGEALVFVHGYNVRFVDGLRRTAQLAKDLDFSGVAIAYSWPSEGSHLSYTVDETNVRWTEPHFREFIELCVRELGLSDVHVIAHSMGSRVLAETLGKYPSIGLQEGNAHLHQIVFAAPDIDTDTFRDLSAQFKDERRKCTLYASSNDLALKASKVVHKHSRAGDSGKDLVVVPGVDTVDATRVDTSLVGHSYFGDNRTLIGDLFGLIIDGKPPDQRFAIESAERDGARFWRFR